MTDNVYTALLDSISTRAEAEAIRENEIMGPDGLLLCKVCGKKLETVLHVKIADRVDEQRKVRCRCDCLTEAEKREKQIKAFEAHQERERRRRACFTVADKDGKKSVSPMIDWNFSRDDRQRPELSDAMQQYAKYFDENFEESEGLLLYGDVGTGKTYMAACVANAVIDQGYTARVATFGQIGNEMQQTWEKQNYIDELCGFDLLIIDDLGAERKSEYMQEIVFNVIDTRCRAGGPLIVTTNLTADELSKPSEMGHKRIYDRILEKCTPIKVDGQSRRRKAAAKRWEAMREKLGMEVQP